VIWIFFLFSTLGISASDFFCPNLASISVILGLDENVAGVTFLALGNGSPDVFSTFSAMKANSGGLAIGELIGQQALSSQSLSEAWPSSSRSRSIAAFLEGRGLLYNRHCGASRGPHDGIIRILEAGLLVLLYASYVTIVVVGSWQEKRRERRRAKENALRSQYAEDSGDAPVVTVPYRDEPAEGYRDDESE